MSGGFEVISHFCSSWIVIWNIVTHQTDDTCCSHREKMGWKGADKQIWEDRYNERPHEEVNPASSFLTAQRWQSIIEVCSIRKTGHCTGYQGLIIYLRLEYINWWPSKSHATTSWTVREVVINTLYGGEDTRREGRWIVRDDRPEIRYNAWQRIWQFSWQSFH